MKRLLIALVAAVAVSTGFAKLTYTQGFEGESYDPSTDFEPSVADEDASEIADHGAVPDMAVPYDFNGFGSKYYALDTGDATLWRTNAGEAAYFDMVMQFNPSASAPTLDTETKIAVYLNSSSNLVVLAGPKDGDDPTEYVTSRTLNPGDWGRLTISAVANGFEVRLNTTPVTATVSEEVVSVFPSLTGDATIKAVGFKGSGALDDFVARTTDPYIQNPAATIGGEGYASLADALADDPTATPQLEADASLATPLAYGESISVKLNNHTLSGITSGSLIALASTSGDVTTYTAGYFPRTATADQDGSADHPYEIADSDDIIALQDAILADAATFASKSYVQTNNIDMASTSGFYGIGWFKSTDEYDSLPVGATKGTDLPFSGTYDGAGYKLSNVKLVRHNYAGVFNLVANSGLVKNLTVENIYFTGTQGECGCGIVGNVQDNAILENLTSAGTAWGWDAVNRPSDVGHNSGGIAVRAEDNAIIRYCVNNASFTSGARRLGGIVGFTGATAASDSVKILCCTNYGDITSTYAAGNGRGAGGIIASPETTQIANTVIGGCANFGTVTASNEGNPSGAIVGTLKVNTNSAFKDDGGNTFLASVAMVGDRGLNTKTITGLAYALPVTIAEANYLTTVKQADLAAGNTYTLLANVAASETPVFTLAEATDTIAFDTAKGFTFAGTVAVDRSKLMPATSETVGTVTTYSTTAGVASVNDVAYATFADAVAAAVDQGAYVKLLDNVEYEFADAITLSVDINGKSISVTYADGVIGSHSEKDGLDVYTVQKVVATVGTDKFATLQAAIAAAVAGETKTVDLVGAATGAVNIPEGITVNAASGASMTETSVSALTGSGVLNIPNLTAFNAVVWDSAALFRNSAWEGTLAVNGVVFTSDSFYYYGNANSTVRFSNVTINQGFGSAANNNVKAFEIVGGGVEFSGISADMYFPCPLKGDGPITVTAAPDTQYTINFTGDVSEYAGSITLATSGKARVAFGTTGITGNNNCMVIGSDASVTVAAGKTWTAPGGFVLNGTLVVNGSLAPSSTALYGAGGTVTFTSSGMIPVGQYWTGTFNANFNSGNGNYAFDLPINAGATTVINGVDGTFCGYPRFSNGAPTVAGPIVLNADWVSSNGYSRATTTFAKLSGTGDVIVEGTDGQFANGDKIPYVITELDSYLGTLGGRAGSYTIGHVNVATLPASGTRVVKTAIGANGSINDDVPLYVAGADSGKTLTYDASGAEGAGLYYYEPVVYFDVNFFKDAGKTEKIGDTRSVVSGEKATAPEAPTKTGYTFTGWDPDTNAVIVAATDFVAQWSADGYTITFDANGGSVDPATTNFTIESGTITLPTPTHSGVGVTFNGWTNATYTTGIKSFTPAAGNLGNFTLVADWTVPGPATEVDPVSNDPVPVTATDAEDAKSQVDVAVPKSGAVADAIATGQAADPTYDYAKNFDKVATYDTESGKWEVTVKIADAVEADVATDAAEILDGTSSTVTVPAGLYYKVTTYTALGGTGTPAVPTTLSTGAASSAISKPGTAQGQGFIKVEMATTAEELAD